MPASSLTIDRIINCDKGYAEEMTPGITGMLLVRHLVTCRIGIGQGDLEQVGGCL